MALWLSQLQALIVKEITLFFRDPLFPILLLLCFTVTVHSSASGEGKNELRQAAFAVVDHDQTPASREFVGRLREPFFVLKGSAASGAEGVRMLDDGEVMMVVDIPEGYQRTLAAGENAEVQLQLDATNAVLAQLASSYAQSMAAGGAAAQAGPRVENRVREFYRVAYRDDASKAIKAIGPLILLFAMILPAAAMAREKERGTVEQMLVSPASPFQVMLSKVLPMAGIICAASMLTLFVVIHRWLGLPTRGSSLLFVFVTGLYAVNVCGVGLLISTVTRSVGQVGLVSMLIMPPLLLLSGVYSPPEGMPPALRPFTNFSPVYHYQNASFAILLKGATLAEVWPSVAAMAALGGVIFALGVRQFRAQFR
jgi:ABC-2 type transport system permease protein